MQVARASFFNSFKASLIIMHCLRLSSAIFLFYLAGCSSIHTIPIIADDNPYLFAPDTAIVIVGAFGEATVRSIVATSSDPDSVYKATADKSGVIDAFAWEVKVGETYRIKSVSMDQWPSVVLLDRPYTLAVSEKGIYYYGCLVNDGENVALSKKAFQEVTKKAGDKYPTLFGNLRTINF